MNLNLKDLSRTKLAQNLMKQAGFNAPPELRRDHSQWHDQYYSEEVILLQGDGQFNRKLGGILRKHGAVVQVADADLIEKLQSCDGLAVSQVAVDQYQSRRVIYDASGVRTVAQLGELYEFFNQLTQNLGVNARVVFLNRPKAQCTSIEERTAWHGIEGFMRSFAKEIAAKGGIAQLFTIADEEVSLQRISAALEFFLSDYATYITGQVIAFDNQVVGEVSGQLVGSLAGKTALVTGAAGGIGEAVVEALFHEGCHVIAVDHPGAMQQLQDLAAKCEGEALTVDFSQDNPEAYIVRQIIESNQKIDCVVHCAGITRDKTIKNMSRESWNAVLDINLHAVLAIDRALLAEDLIADGGRIITLSSISGIAGNFGQSSYSTSKAALIGYTQALAKELAPRGITVNAVAPGFIETPMTAKVPAVNKYFYKRLSIFSQAGLPIDVAHGICFLASPESVGISGRVLRICGGHIMGV